MDGRDLPMGFSMALGQNVDAMQAFTSLSLQEQQNIVDRTHQIKSKSEMQRFVQSLAENKQNFFG